MSEIQMERGRMYRVRYTLPGVYIKTREFVAMYLGVTTVGTHEFSGRPEFGTSALPHDAVVEEIVQVPDTDLPYAPRIVKGAQR